MFSVIENRLTYMRKRQRIDIDFQGIYQKFVGDLTVDNKLICGIPIFICFHLIRIYIQFDMEKLSFKNQISLSKLIETASSFCLSFKLNKLMNQSKFGHRALQGTNQRFIKCLIAYVTSKQFSIIADQDKNQQIGLLKTIRDSYYNMSVVLLKKQTQFEAWLLYMTKIISCFYQEVFLDFIMNKALESEIYVILVHSLIGLSVNKRSYQLLYNKYFLGAQTPNIKAKQEKKIKIRNILSKGSSIYYRTETPDSKNGGELINHNSQDYQELRSFLRTNLQFNSLPKVKICKKSQEMSLKEDKENSSFNTTQYEGMMKKKMISSHQNSTSFETQLMTHKVASSTQHKAFRVPHRIQFKSSHSSYEKGIQPYHFNTKDKIGAKDQKKFLKNENYQSWKKILKDLSSPSFQQPIKHDLQVLFLNREKKNRYEKDDIPEFFGRRESQTYHEALPQAKQTEDCNQKEEDKDMGSPPLKIDHFTRNFKQIQVKQTEDLSRRVKKNVLKSHQLRQKQNQFQEKINLRSKKIEYSLFLLPNAQSNMNGIS